jgi:hypothetical protein
VKSLRDDVIRAAEDAVAHWERTGRQAEDIWIRLVDAVKALQTAQKARQSSRGDDESGGMYRDGVVWDWSTGGAP